MMRSVYIILAIAVYLPTVKSLCSHPCSRVNRGVFTNGQTDFLFGCQNSSIVRVFERGQFIEDRECFIRSGPFLVLRIGNEFQCFKDTVYDPNTNVVFIYTFPRRRYDGNPLLCDVCSGAMTLAMFVAEGQDLEAAGQIPPPPVGCNRPPNCPAQDPYDIPCTGCEPKEDDGLCCASCRAGITTRPTVGTTGGYVGWNRHWTRQSRTPSNRRYNRRWRYY